MYFNHSEIFQHKMCVKNANSDKFQCKLRELFSIYVCVKTISTFLDVMKFNFQLMDLPTIMETWKSIDGKNFYKTADVCQVRWLKI